MLLLKIKATNILVYGFLVYVLDIPNLPPPENQMNSAKMALVSLLNHAIQKTLTMNALVMQICQTWFMKLVSNLLRQKGKKYLKGNLFQKPTTTVFFQTNFYIPRDIWEKVINAILHIIAIICQSTLRHRLVVSARISFLENVPFLPYTEQIGRFTYSCL